MTGSPAVTDDAVITGIGVVAPVGSTTPDYWAATLRGATGIAPISRFDPARYPVSLAGQIDGFDEASHVPGRLMPQTDRVTRLALAAAAAALSDAEVKPAELPEFTMGVGTASTSGGLEFGQRELQKLWGQGWEHVSAYMSFAWYYAVNTGQISIRHGMRGPGGVVIAEQAGGLDAIGYARRQLAKGTRLMVTGGVDSTLCPYGLTIQVTDPALSRSTDPAAAYLPFDSRASGYVVGEGGAILVLESQSAALARGAPGPYGRLAGYAAAFDPDPGSGDGLLRAARTALERARLAAADIGLVVADAAGVRALDMAEVSVICAIFGEGGVPVAVSKTATGRLLSGGAALDVATALLALRHGVIPPGINVRRSHADPRLDLVLDAPRAASMGAVMVLARGHGGFASAMILARCD